MGGRGVGVLYIKTFLNPTQILLKPTQNLPKPAPSLPKSALKPGEARRELYEQGVVINLRWGLLGQDYDKTFIVVIFFGFSFITGLG